MVNVGILGTGEISERMVQSASLVENLNVVGVLSRDVQKARDFSRKNHVEMYFSNYDDLLKNERINTVYVALPNSLHYEFTLRAIKAGKSVIVEKPFVSNLNECNKLMEAAKVEGVYLFELDRVIGTPGFLTIQKHMEEIAPIRLVTINYSQYSRRYDELLAGKVNNVFSDEFSGGALYDLGVYGVHLVTGLFGPPLEVSYLADTLPSTIDVSGILALKYVGMIANLVHSKNSRSENNMTFQGEKGTIYVSPTPSRILQVKVAKFQEEELIIANEIDSTVSNLREITRIMEKGDQDRFLKKLEHIHFVMEVLVKARKSAGIVFKADKSNSD